MNNLFDYSPKELTTDGFLAWLICEVRNDSNQILSLFTDLGLCNSTAGKILNAKVSLQAGSQKGGRVDLIVEYDVDGERCKALFENKTYTTIHSDQLAKYKALFPDCKHYKYLKLARINYQEEKLTKENGYDRITSADLLTALNSITLKSGILDQYKDFLQRKFIAPLEEIEATLLCKNNYGLFRHRQAQHYLIDRLYKKIDGTNEDIRFNSKSNVGGSPWTTLRIAKREKAYGDHCEHIYWRVDKKSGNYYLRLNQYAAIGSSFKSTKRENLGLLRSSLKPVLAVYSDIQFSRPSNKGTKESEVFILLFKDNELGTIDKVLASLTNEVVATYNSISFK